MGLNLEDKNPIYTYQYGDAEIPMISVNGVVIDVTRPGLISPALSELLLSLRVPIEPQL